jgi:hypothetical protein
MPVHAAYFKNEDEANVNLNSIGRAELLLCPKIIGKKFGRRGSTAQPCKFA